MATCQVAWPQPQPESKAGLRWWWPGSAVDDANIKWNIEEYAKAHNIVVVNPLSTRESVIVDNPNVVKVKPGEVGQILIGCDS